MLEFLMVLAWLKKGQAGNSEAQKWAHGDAYKQGYSAPAISNIFTLGKLVPAIESGTVKMIWKQKKTKGRHSYQSAVHAHGNLLHWLTAS